MAHDFDPRVALSIEQAEALLRLIDEVFVVDEDVQAAAFSISLQVDIIKRGIDALAEARAEDLLGVMPGAPERAA